jgi:hypothetical protein
MSHSWSRWLTQHLLEWAERVDGPTTRAWISEKCEALGLFPPPASTATLGSTVAVQLGSVASAVVIAAQIIAIAVVAFIFRRQLVRVVDVMMAWLIHKASKHVQRPPVTMQPAPLSPAAITETFHSPGRAVSGVDTGYNSPIHSQASPSGAAASPAASADLEGWRELVADQRQRLVDTERRLAAAQLQVDSAEQRVLDAASIARNALDQLAELEEQNATLALSFDRVTKYAALLEGRG